MWRFVDCRLEYTARLGDTNTRFTVTATRGGSSVGTFSLEYPPDLAPSGARSSLVLQLRDDNRWMSVFRTVEISPGHAATHGYYEDDAEAPPPWSHIGSLPGLRVFFPPVTHFSTPDWKTGWDPMSPIESVAVGTRLEGWFSIGGNMAALVTARSENDRFSGSYLVLASGRLLWARVVVGGQPHVLEARLVSACDGPTLQPLGAM